MPFFTCFFISCCTILEYIRVRRVWADALSIHISNYCIHWKDLKTLYDPWRGSGSCLRSERSLVSVQSECFRTGSCWGCISCDARAGGEVFFSLYFVKFFFLLLSSPASHALRWSGHYLGCARSLDLLPASVYIIRANVIASKSPKGISSSTKQIKGTAVLKEMDYISGKQ